MNRKFVLISLILFSWMMPDLLHAQFGMTDQQIMSYAIEQRAQGKDMTEIGQELLMQGVTIEQLQRLRSQYSQFLGQQSLNMGMGNSISSNISNTRLRDTYLPDSLIFVNLFGPLVSDSLDGKKIYGHDIFQFNKLSFESNSNMPTPEDYVLGAGDKVFIDVYGASQKNFELDITPDGSIVVPNIGPVQISGLTVSQANNRVKQQLNQYYENSQIKLTVGKTRTIMVNIMGEVRAPGTYHMSSLSTMFNALYLAGGVNQLGTLRSIKLYRNGKVAATSDLYEFITHGKMDSNLRLRDNDVIIVSPYEALVEVAGSAKRPMFYEVKKNEPLSSILNYAGGLAADAYDGSIRITRQTNNRKTIFNVTLHEADAFQLNDGDVITIDTGLNRLENTVEIQGAVFRPGQYQLGGNINTIGQLIKAADGVTEEAFLGRAVLQRVKADRTTEVIALDLDGILNHHSGDLPLNNEDLIIILDQAETFNGRTLTIHGEVYKPGQYKYSDNMTIEDLVVMAGGLTDAASVTKVDVARRITDPKATSDSPLRARTYSFSLKEGLLASGDKDFTLEPYDEIYVRRSPGYNEQENVSVTGEVMYAGVYALSAQNTRISDILNEAGGPNGRAYLKGARLRRVYTEAEIIRNQQQHQLNNTDQDHALLGTLKTGDTYFVGVDIENALKNPGCDDDVILQKGDEIIIPQYSGTVKVNGEVSYPNTVSYLKGKRGKYYVDQAGGFSNMARRCKAYIVYPNGHVAKLRRNTKVEPGSEIFVPSKEKRNNTTTAMQWASISSSVVTAAAVLISIFK